MGVRLGLTSEPSVRAPLRAALFHVKHVQSNTPARVAQFWTQWDAGLLLEPESEAENGGRWPMP